MIAKHFPGEWKKSFNDYNYFLPASLKQSQEIQLSPHIFRHMQNAAFALGKFSSLIERIPNPHQFIHAYAVKEAQLSSRIEGTQTNIEDALKTETEIEPEKHDDWAEVQAYIKAMNEALDQRNELPLCNRLIKNAHKTLLSQVRGQHKFPGEFRTSQNWIGGSRPDNAHYVPPAHEHIGELMSDLEKFIQDNTLVMPELINAAFLHYQFETIHPFLDGNGRMGRMLISLYFLEKKLLKHPILYISTFFEEHRTNYYAALDKAREGSEGVSKWVSFFLDAVEQTAQDGIEVTQKLLDYDLKLRTEILPQFGRKTKDTLRVLEFLYRRPILTSKQLQEQLEFSPQVSQNMLKLLAEHNILQEITGNKRNRVFMFHQYITLLEGKKET